MTWLSFARVLVPEVLRCPCLSVLPKHFTGLICYGGFFISGHVQSSGNTNTSLCLQFLNLPLGKTVSTVTAPLLVTFSNFPSPRWIYLVLSSCAKSLNDSIWLHIWRVALSQLSTARHAHQPSVHARQATDVHFSQCLLCYLLHLTGSPAFILLTLLTKLPNMPKIATMVTSRSLWLFLPSITFQGSKRLLLT